MQCLGRTLLGVRYDDHSLDERLCSDAVWQLKHPSQDRANLENLLIPRPTAQKRYGAFTLTWRAYMPSKCWTVPYNRAPSCENREVVRTVQVRHHCNHCKHSINTTLFLTPSAGHSSRFSWPKGRNRAVRHSNLFSYLRHMDTRASLRTKQRQAQPATQYS